MNALDHALQPIGGLRLSRMPRATRLCLEMLDRLDGGALRQRQQARDIFSGQGRVFVLRGKRSVGHASIHSFRRSRLRRSHVRMVLIGTA